MRVDLSYLRQFPFKQCSDLLDRRCDRDADLHCAYSGPSVKIDHISDLVIVDGLDLMGPADDLCRPDADLQHLSLEIADLDMIPDNEGPLKDNTQPGDNVCHYVFCSQRYGEGDHSQGGKERYCVDADIAQRHTEGPDKEQILQEALDQAQHRIPYGIRQGEQHAEDDAQKEIEQIAYSACHDHCDQGEKVETLIPVSPKDKAERRMPGQRGISKRDHGQDDQYDPRPDLQRRFRLLLRQHTSPPLDHRAHGRPSSLY